MCSTAAHTCVYYGCPNTRNWSPGISFYKFPIKNKTRCEQWALNSGNVKIQNMEIEQLSSKLICEAHFPPENFKDETASKKSLIWNATPLKYSETSSSSKSTSNVVAMDTLPLERVDTSTKVKPAVVYSNVPRKRKATSKQEEQVQQPIVPQQASFEIKITQMEKTINQLETKNKSLFAKCMEVSLTNKALTEENKELRNKLKSLDSTLEKTLPSACDALQSNNNLDMWDKYYPTGELNTETLATMWKEVSTIPVPNCTCTKDQPYIYRRPPRSYPNRLSAIQNLL